MEFCLSFKLKQNSKIYTLLKQCQKKELEKKSGRKVVTNQNYKALTEKQKRQIVSSEEPRFRKTCDVTGTFAWRLECRKFNRQ